ncbi:Heterokaryon incompatibility domain-containing protein [Madurella fahalii]|uniref:Heterokaryon incompatibility domain-containing protein n=1 Tax=Madurella fahalii TaxID=1157608 RepID=A0ABQ0G2F4_9PEZI
MEHLLAPAGSKPINIPYVGTETFESADSRAPDDTVLSNFKGYWQRKGWEVDRETKALKLDHRAPSEVVSLLQTAFYFGCLISIFREVEIAVRTEDFLERAPGHSAGKIFVRTTKLRDLMRRWIQKETQSNFNSSARIHRGYHIREMLGFTFHFFQGIMQKSDRMQEPHKSDMELIGLSIMAMGESMHSVAATIYGYDARETPEWGPSPVLKARLRDNGWCVSDAPFFPDSPTRSTISIEYYFGGMACPRERGDHSACTTAICSKYLEVVDWKTYQQKHVVPSCRCAPVQVAPAAAEIVEQTRIPVVHWDGESLRVFASDSVTKYVTISHVWADGLGNNQTNSLLTCQLNRVQRLVNQLYTESHLSSSHHHETAAASAEGLAIPFWIDTLCVPVHNKILRRKAIYKMADIYRGADRVLVIDSTIITLPRAADVVQKHLQISLSGWHHRLWTLQEGQLASTLFFQFADGAESFYDMSRRELADSSNPRDPATLCSPVRYLCATQLEAFYRYFERGVTASDDITTRLRLCAKYQRSRQTSRPIDEPLCMAAILGLDPSPMFPHDEDIVERMAVFYQLIGRFDPRIIFHNLPRLPKDGYRWAPASFLHQVPDLLEGVEELSAQAPPAVALIPNNAGGLPVRFGGLEIILGANVISSSSNPGPIFFRPWAGGYAFPPQQWTYDNKSAWFMCTYKLEILPDPNGKYPELNLIGASNVNANADARYAVIFPPKGLLKPDQLPPMGLLGLIEANIPPNPTPIGHTGGFGFGFGMMNNTVVWTAGDHKPGNHVPAYTVPWRIPVRCAGRVRVTMPATHEVPAGVSFAFAVAFGENQEWCVR